MSASFPLLSFFSSVFAPDSITERSLGPLLPGFDAGTPQIKPYKALWSRGALPFSIHNVSEALDNFYRRSLDLAELGQDTVGEFASRDRFNEFGSLPSFASR
jgi:hypothetical protein